MMTVALSADLEEIVNAGIQSGQFNSKGEVIREGLRLLQEQNMLRQIKLEQFRREVAIGVEAADRGELIPAEEVFQELYQRNREAAGQK